MLRSVARTRDGLTLGREAITSASQRPHEFVVTLPPAPAPTAFTTKPACIRVVGEHWSFCGSPWTAPTPASYVLPINDHPGAGVTGWP